MKDLYLKQQREYYSKEPLPATDSINVELFTKSGFNENTNLDIPNQIINSGIFTIYVWMVTLSLKRGLKAGAGDIALINKIIMSGRIRLLVNKIDVTEFSLNQCLTPTLSGAGSANYFRATSGIYKLNIPVRIGMGQSFKCNFLADPKDDASALEIKAAWDGILDLSQEVAVVKSTMG